MNSAVTTLVFFAFTHHHIATLRRTHDEFRCSTSLRPSSSERGNQLARLARLLAYLPVPAAAQHRLW